MNEYLGAEVRRLEQRIASDLALPLPPPPFHPPPPSSPSTPLPLPTCMQVRRLEQRIASDLALVQMAQAELEAAARERDDARAERDEEGRLHSITKAELEEARRLLP